MVQAGGSGKYLLTPVIKVLESVENSVGGQVDDGVSPLVKGVVSAQIYDPDAEEPENKVIVEGVTVSDDAGAYLLFLPPDSYYMVAVKPGFEPACSFVEAAFYENYTVDFTLAAAATGTLSGAVEGLDDVEDSVLISIRQAADCGLEDITNEAASERVAEGGSFSFTLPAGQYEVVASAPAKAALVYGVEVKAGEETVRDINF